MPTALIETLITAEDVAEQVRDQIVAILAVESASQMALAAAAGKDPLEWRLLVYRERAVPWAQYTRAPDQVDATPTVNISRQSETYELGPSSVVSRQKATGIFFVDVYGYGLSADDAEGGQILGDETAALEVQRAVRLVRNILMAGHWTYLGMQKTVERRWLQSVTQLQPQLDNKAAQHVVAARMTFAVDFRENSPQVVGVPFESLFLQLKRADDGRLYAESEFDFDS